MKSLRIFYLTAITILAGMFFTACENKDFEAGPEVDGAQVYFPSYIATEYSVGDDISSITIPINRLDSESALTVNILCEDESGLFSIPATATFKAGESTTSFDISFDRTALVDGSDYPVSLFLNDEDNTTPYGNSQLNIVVTPWPWELYKDGKGKLRGADAFCGLWEMDYMAEIDVTVYKHKSKDGIYMIESPWAMVTTAGWGYEDPLEAIESYFNYVDTNLVIDCSDPAHIHIDYQFTGLTHPNYGEWWIASLDAYTGKPSDAGTMENGVITFPEKGMLFSMSGYKDGTLYYGNVNGMFRILLPGAEVTDYSLAVEYDGMKVEADGATASAIINFFYGADVTGIKYVVAEGAISDAEVATTVEAIFNATAENVNEIKNLNAESDTISEKFELATSGVYSVVAVALDKAGQPTEKGIAAINFFFPGMGGATAPDCDIAVELMNVSDFNPNLLAQYPNETSLAVMITGTDLAEVTYYINTTEVIETIIDGSAEVTWDYVMSEFGNKWTSDQFDFLAQNGYWGGIFSKRTPGTSYTIAVLGKNIYGKSALVMSTCSTTEEVVEDDGIGIVTGTYSMTGTNEKDNTFIVEADGDSTTKYIISDLALELNGMFQWHATYNSATSKLTLNGTLVGEEENGNLFSYGLVWLDSAHTQMLAFWSGLENGDDPCVFSVDPTTKEISKLDTYLSADVFSSDGSYVGTYAEFTAETPVKWLGEVSTAAKIAAQQSRNVQLIDKNVKTTTTFKGNGAKNNVLKNAKATSVNASRSNKIATLKVNAQACEPLQKTVNRNIKSGAASLKAVK